MSKGKFIEITIVIIIKVREFNLSVLSNAILLEHNSKQLVEILRLKVLPPMVCQLVLELLSAHSVGEFSKDVVNEVIYHALVGRSILLHLIKVDLIIDTHGRLLDHLLHQFLDNGCRAD